MTKALDEALQAVEAMNEGYVKIDLPKPKWSSRNILTEEFARYERDRKRQEN